jgi:hypothetical protein
MTPKEKAKELYDKFHFAIPSYADEGQQEHKSAKECALIAVDEIIQEIERINEYEYTASTDYWEEVKQEIIGGVQ